MADLEYILDNVLTDGSAYFTAGDKRYVRRVGSFALEPLAGLPQARADDARRVCSIAERGRRFTAHADAVQYALAVSQYQQLLEYAVQATRGTGGHISDDETRAMFRAAFKTVQAHLVEHRVPVLRTIPGASLEYLSMAPEQVCAQLDARARSAGA